MSLCCKQEEISINGESQRVFPLREDFSEHIDIFVVVLIINSMYLDQFHKKTRLLI